MRQIINGKVYNTATMETLAEKSCYINGNYCGATKLCKTKSGKLAMVHTSNGQDLYRQEYIEAIALNEIGERLDGWKLTDEEMERIEPYIEEV